MQSKISAMCKTTALVSMAFSVLLLQGCVIDGGSVSASASKNTQTGATTITVSATINIKRAPLQQLALWKPPVTGTDLASTDPTQAILTWGLTNATIVSASGPFTITVFDDNTGATIGQQTFQYVVSGNSLVAQDPTSVSTFLQGFTSYNSVDVTVTANTDMESVTTATTTVTNNAVYQGVTYASGSVSWAGRPPSGGGTCGTSRCPIQQ